MFLVALKERSECALASLVSSESQRNMSPSLYSDGCDKPVPDLSLPPLLLSQLATRTQDNKLSNGPKNTREFQSDVFTGIARFHPRNCPSSPPHVLSPGKTTPIHLGPQAPPSPSSLRSRLYCSPLLPPLAALSRRINALLFAASGATSDCYSHERAR